MNWTRCQKSVEFKIYIYNKFRYVQHVRFTSISNILYARLTRFSSISSMLIMWFFLFALLDFRASRACQSRDLFCSLVKRFEQYTCYDEPAYPRYWSITCLKLVTLVQRNRSFEPRLCSRSHTSLRLEHCFNE